MARARRHWLFKTEPAEFSIDDLRRRRTARWDGVRNYQARNLLRDEVRKGDGVLVYHSSVAEPAIVGTATVARAAYPDPTAFDPDSPYHDARSNPIEPRWVSVDVRFEAGFSRPLTRSSLMGCARLAGMMVLKRGMRLSIQPVSNAEWNVVLKLAGHLE